MKVIRYLLEAYIYFAKITEIFKQSIIRYIYINKPQYLVRLILALTVCLRLLFMLYNVNSPLSVYL